MKDEIPTWALVLFLIGVFISLCTIGFYPWLYFHRFLHWIDTTL